MPEVNRKLTDYENYEIIIIENNSTEEKTLNTMNRFAMIRSVSYTGKKNLIIRQLIILVQNRQREIIYCC